MTDRDPTRLGERSNEVGAAVRQYAQATQPDPGEAATFAAVERRLRSRLYSGWRPIMLAAAIGLVALWFVLKPRPVEITAHVTEPTPISPPAPSVARHEPNESHETAPPARPRNPPRARNTTSIQTAPQTTIDMTDESMLAAVAQQLRENGHLKEALTAFEDQRTRFPRGLLRADADRAVVDLLVRLGRPAEALADSELSLAGPLAPDQKAALHVLRGQIYRDVFGDQAQATREYGLAEALRKSR